MMIPSVKDYIWHSCGNKQEVSCVCNIYFNVLIFLFYIVLTQRFLLLLLFFFLFDVVCCSTFNTCSTLFICVVYGNEYLFVSSILSWYFFVIHEKIILCYLCLLLVSFSAIFASIIFIFICWEEFRAWGTSICICIVCHRSFSKAGVSVGRCFGWVASCDIS